METSRLYKIAEIGNIAVDFGNLPHNRAFCVNYKGKKIIAIDKGFQSDSAEERVALAHELGHCSTDGFYSVGTPLLYRRRLEKRAEIWAIENLVPKNELSTAIANGTETVSDLAEHFAVTEDFMQKAIKYYGELEYGK